MTFFVVTVLVLLACWLAVRLLLNGKPFHGGAPDQFRRIDHELNKAYRSAPKP